MPYFTREHAVWEQLRPFIGLASEWEDHDARRPEYEADIVAAAKELLAGGGST